MIAGKRGGALRPSVLIYRPCITLLLTVSTLANCSSTDYAAKERQTRILEAKDTTQDYGIYWQDMLEFSFEVCNTGNSDLSIESVKGTCGCTEVRFEPKSSLKPREIGHLVGTIDTRSFTGNQSKAILLKSNCDETPLMQFDVSFQKPFVGVAPRVLDVQFKGLQASPVRHIVSVRNHQYKTLRLEAWQSTSSSVSCRPMRGGDAPIVLDGDRSCEFEIQVGPDNLPVGRFEDKVVFRFDSNGRKIESVLVIRVERVPEVVAEPERIMFGKLTQADVQRGVEVGCGLNSSVSGEVLRVKEIRCTDPDLRFEKTISESSKSSFIVRLQSNNTTGYISTHATVIIDDNKNIDIPIVAYW